MARIVECIPNISEGRNAQVIEAVLNEVRSTPGVTLLDHSSDVNHNRTVITFLGSPEGVADAAEYYLQIENFDGEKQVLENYLL